MSKRFVSMFVIVVLLSSLVAVLLFEVAYQALDLRYFRPPLALNIKLHEKSATFNIEVNEQLRSRSNASLSSSAFSVRTGANWEIIGGTGCQFETPPIFVLGSSTTEQKLVKEGMRWVDQLNKKYGEDIGHCLRNYGYGGINLLHATDNFYFLSSLESPAAVILMSNATDVGQLLKYQSYTEGTNHKHKTRVVYDGGVPMHDYKYFPALSHVFTKFFKKNEGENSISLTEDLNSDHVIKLSKLYLQQFREFSNLARAKDIPLVYVEEPRISDLSLLATTQANSINENYKKQGVDYRDMATLHKNFSNVVREEIERSAWGCYVETNKLNFPEFLYDEGHLNELGSERLSDFIGPILENIDRCK